MMIIDTHAHLFVDEFKEDLEEVVDRARNEGVSKILLPNIDENTIEPLKRAQSLFPDIFLSMMGLHPSNVTKEWKKQLDIIYQELNNNENYIAIGEIGIDLYWEKSNLDIQKAAFEQQLEWSIQKNKPVSMHSRDALMEVIDSIKRIGKDKVHGVFHSFGGNPSELEEVLSLENFFIGINGVVTFKNSGLDKVLVNCPLDRLVIETDSPWLAPVPYRGKRNESSYLKEIIKKLSSIHNISEKEIADITTKNAHNLFNI